MDRIHFLASLFDTKDLVIADIGSDHGYLSIELAQTNPNRHIYNIEINQEPLNNSISNVNKANLSHQIDCVLNDGLKDWKHPISFDAICISGMGGKNIVDILNNANKDVTIQKLVLSPNNNVAALRRYLVTNGYRFIIDTWINDHNVNYPVLVVSRSTGEVYQTEADIYFGKLNLQSLSPEFIDYYKNLYSRIINKKLDQVSEKYNREYHLIYEYLKEYL